VGVRLSRWMLLPPDSWDSPADAHERGAGATHDGAHVGEVHVDQPGPHDDLADAHHAYVCTCVRVYVYVCMCVCVYVCEGTEVR
jgi:hypothetical protein